MSKATHTIPLYARLIGDGAIYLIMFCLRILNRVASVKVQVNFDNATDQHVITLRKK